MEEIKRFRQLGSRTPGHPESHITSGVETTTGPLGQGVGNSVGMAIASKWQAANFNRPDFEIFDFNVYAMCSDGDLMEGIGGEAASLAGHLKLSNLCWIYDHNHITLDGPAELVVQRRCCDPLYRIRMERDASGRCQRSEMLARAFEIFHKTKDRPTLIIVDSHIGYGSPHKQDTMPLTANLWAKKKCGWSRNSMAGRKMRSSWCRTACASIFAKALGSAGVTCTRSGRSFSRTTRRSFPIWPSACSHMQHHELPAGWDKNLPTFPADAKGIATRESSGKVLNVVAQNIPWIIGGSADLATSNKTTLKFEGAGDFQAGQLRGTQPAFRCARACDGRERERAERFGHSRVRRDFL